MRLLHVSREGTPQAQCMRQIRWMAARPNGTFPVDYEDSNVPINTCAEVRRVYELPLHCDTTIAGCTTTASPT